MHVVGDTYPARGTSQACTERAGVVGVVGVVGVDRLVEREIAAGGQLAALLAI
jgi:hypothetical protein